MNTIQVYDVIKKKFRNINPHNYNDDLTIGAIILKRTALEELKQFFVICGYTIINKKDKSCYPIDIHSERIVIFEGTYNCFPDKLKERIVPLIITSLIEPLFSQFFFEWNLLNNWDCFTNNGDFIEMCAHFNAEQKIIDRMLREDISIIAPQSYDELCEMTKNAILLSGADFYSPNYIEKYKYLVDALVHHFHINFTSAEVQEYMYQISHIINKHWEDHHV